MSSYHQKTLALIHEPPITSPQAETQLAQLERERAFRLPASVWEWYSLAHGVSLLEEYSNADRAVHVEQLGAVDRYWSGGSYHDHDLFVKGLLPILTENQGICTWAIQLDGSDDPPVAISFENTMPFAHFDVCAASFSLFVYTRAWDYQVILSEHLLYGSEGALAPVDMDFLRSQFQEEPQTFIYPGFINYRFFREGQHLLVWEGEQQTDWWLSADSEERLGQLAEAMWKCGTLAHTLEGYTPTGEAVLKKMR